MEKDEFSVSTHAHIGLDPIDTESNSVLKSFIGILWYMSGRITAMTDDQHHIPRLMGVCQKGGQEITCKSDLLKAAAGL
jgi:hypothetical protein